MALRPILHLLRVAWVRKLLRLSAIPVLKTAAGLGEAMHRLHDGIEDWSEPPKPEHCNFCQSISAFPNIEYDEIIVGSGPGGSVVARNAAALGKKTLVIEMGANPSRSLHQSPRQLLLDFHKAAQEFGLLDNKIFQFSQGACWGGGSEVNSGLFHEIPLPTLENWSKATGLPVEELLAAQSHTKSVMKVKPQSEETLGLYRNSKLREVGEELGFDIKLVERWRTYFSPANFDHHGMENTYLSDFLKKGGNRVVGHEVLKIYASKKTNTNPQILIRCPQGYNHRITARERLVLSAGVLGTPKILVNSRLAKVSDFKFGTHIMGRIFAIYERPVNDGVDIDPHQAFESAGMGKIGMSVTNTDLLASTLRASGVGDLNVRRVLPLYYSLPFKGASKLSLVPGIGMLPILNLDKTRSKELQELREKLVNAVERTGGKSLSSSASYSSVHVFGSTPIGHSSVVNADGSLVGYQGRIVIRDSSILPSSPGVNPQGPLMTLVEALERR